MTRSRSSSSCRRRSSSRHRLVSTRRKQRQRTRLVSTPQVRKLPHHLEAAAAVASAWRRAAQVIRPAIRPSRRSDRRLVGRPRSRSRSRSAVWAVAWVEAVASRASAASTNRMTMKLPPVLLSQVYRHRYQLSPCVHMHGLYLLKSLPKGCCVSSSLPLGTHGGQDRAEASSEEDNDTQEGAGRRG